MTPATYAAKPWTCPDCDQERTSRFCPQCGEEVPQPRRLSLRSIVAKLVHEGTSVDGKLLRTLRELFMRPGSLTSAFAKGRRIAYVSPFRVFLFANVLFFVVQSLTHTNVFSSPLRSHLNDQDWRELAREMTMRRVEQSGMTLENLAVAFDQAVVLNAKSLIIVMVAPFAALLSLAMLRGRQPFGVHLAFSLHQYAYLLFLFCVSLVVAKLDAWLGGGGIASQHVDLAISLFILACFLAYLYLAIGRVYRVGRFARVGGAVLMSVVAAGLVLGYRFALFVLTIYTVGRPPG